jgi:hypothetical protein
MMGLHTILIEKLYDPISLILSLAFIRENDPFFLILNAIFKYLLYVFNIV